MKKLFVFLALLPAIVSPATGQVVTLKKISFTEFDVPFSYFRYPRIQLGEDYKTYSVEITAPNEDMAKKINSNLKIEGLTWKDKDGDLIMKIDVAPYLFDDPVVIPRTATRKDGKVDTTFILQQNYYVDMKQILLDTHTSKTLYSANEKIDKRPNVTPKVWKREFSTRYDLQAFNTPNQIAKIRKEITEKGIDEFSLGMADKCTIDYGTKRMSTSVAFLRIDDSNYYEYYFDLKYAMLLTKNMRSEQERMISRWNSMIEKFRNAANPNISAKEIGRAHV